MKANHFRAFGICSFIIISETLANSGPNGTNSTDASISHDFESPTAKGNSSRGSQNLSEASTTESFIPDDGKLSSLKNSTNSNSSTDTSAGDIRNPTQQASIVEVEATVRPEDYYTNPNRPYKISLFGKIPSERHDENELNERKLQPDHLFNLSIRSEHQLSSHFVAEDQWLLASFMLCLIILYIIVGVCSCRHKKPPGLQLLPSIGDGYYKEIYLISVFSEVSTLGSLRDTTANISIKLYGELSMTGAIVIREHVLNVPVLKDMQWDSFVLPVTDKLGPLTKIMIWSDCSGRSPDWYCQYVRIQDLWTDRVYFFKVEELLSLRSRAMVTSATINVAKDNEVRKLSLSLGTVIRDALKRYHPFGEMLYGYTRYNYTIFEVVTCEMSLLGFSNMAYLFYLLSPAHGFRHELFGTHLYTEVAVIIVSLIACSYILNGILKLCNARLVPTIAVEEYRKLTKVTKSHILGSNYTSVYQKDLLLESDAKPQRNLDKSKEPFPLPRTDAAATEGWIDSDALHTDSTPEQVLTGQAQYLKRLSGHPSGIDPRMFEKVKSIRSTKEQSFVYAGSSPANIEALVAQEVEENRKSLIEPSRDNPEDKTCLEDIRALPTVNLTFKLPADDEIPGDPGKVVIERTYYRLRSCLCEPLAFGLPFFCRYIVWMICVAIFGGSVALAVLVALQGPDIDTVAEALIKGILGYFLARCFLLPVLIVIYALSTRIFCRKRGDDFWDRRFQVVDLQVMLKLCSKQYWLPQYNTVGYYLPVSVEKKEIAVRKNYPSAVRSFRTVNLVLHVCFLIVVIPLLFSQVSTNYYSIYQAIITRLDAGPRFWESQSSVWSHKNSPFAIYQEVLQMLSQPGRYEVQEPTLETAYEQYDVASSLGWNFVLITLPRLTLWRTSPDSPCTLPAIETNCYDGNQIYSTKSFGLGGWRSPLNESNEADADEYQNPFKFRPAIFPREQTGLLRTYPTGTYVQYLNRSLVGAQGQLENLYFKDWSDKRAKAMFFEVIFYQPAVQLISFIQYRSEELDSAVFSSSISHCAYVPFSPIPKYLTAEHYEFIRMSAAAIVIFILCLKTYFQLWSLKRHGYIMASEVLLVALTVCAIIFDRLHEDAGSEVQDSIIAGTPGPIYWHMADACFYGVLQTAIFTIVYSLAIFMLCLYLGDIFPTFHVLNSVVKFIGVHLTAHLLIMLLIAFCFGAVAHIMFNTVDFKYSSIYRAFSLLLKDLIEFFETPLFHHGRFHLLELSFEFFFTSLMLLVVTNVIVAVLDAGFTDAKMVYNERIQGGSEYAKEQLIQASNKIVHPMRIRAMAAQTIEFMNLVVSTEEFKRFIEIHDYAQQLVVPRRKLWIRAGSELLSGRKLWEQKKLEQRTNILRITAIVTLRAQLTRYKGLNNIQKTSRHIAAVRLQLLESKLKNTDRLIQRAAYTLNAKLQT